MYYINQEVNQIYEFDGIVRYLLYDIYKDPGEAWYVSKYNLNVIVIDTSTMVLEDGSARKVLHTSLHGDYDDYWYFDNIIEGIGLDKSIFPFLELDGPPQSIHDYIRCYSENGVPLIISEEEECDYEILSIEEESMENSFIIHPNPTSEMVHIEGVDVAEVQIFNMLGQKVKTVTNSNEIDMDGLAEGVYLLKVTDKAGTIHTGKVVKKSK